MVYNYAHDTLVPVELNADRSKAKIAGPQPEAVTTEVKRLVEFSFPSVSSKTSGRQLTFHTHAHVEEPPPEADPAKAKGKAETRSEPPPVTVKFPISESSVMILLETGHVYDVSYQNLSDNNTVVETTSGPQKIITDNTTNNQGGAMVINNLNLCEVEMEVHEPEVLKGKPGPDLGKPGPDLGKPGPDKGPDLGQKPPSHGSHDPHKK